MCAWKTTRFSYQETMDHDKWKQPKIPKQLCSSSQSPKLKLHSTKKVQGNLTPISKLCVSVSGSSLSTPKKTAHETIEPMNVDTPQKTPQKFILETPSSTPIYSAVSTPLCASKCTPLDDSRDILDTPKTTNILSPEGTPLCVELGKSLKKKNVSSTPQRRSSRKSVTIKSRFLDDSGCKIISKEDCKPDCLEECSTVLRLFDKSDEFPIVLTRPENEVCNEGKNVENARFRKSLCAGTASTGVDLLDPTCWLPESLQNNMVHHKGITSEPRLSRKSDIGVYSARRLSFSAKKSGKPKNVIPDYDPDNDVFAQGLMPVQFNVDSLKKQIGHLLNYADIPSPQLRKSYSCGVLNDLEDHETQPDTPVSSKRKQTKRTPTTASKKSMKRTLSAPELRKGVKPVIPPPLPSQPPSPPPLPPLPPPLPSPSTTTVSMPTTSGSKVSSEGRIRALLRARDIIKNMRRRAKNASKESSEAIKLPAGTGHIESNGKRIAEENKSSHCHLEIQNQASLSSKNNSFREAIDDYDDILPPTQPFESIILGDVTAYVEVISNNEDISAGVRKELIKLGATVVPAFNRDVPVTHVVFRDGHISTYKKAKKRNIPLVSVSWIEACRKAGVKVHESLFPPHQIERYDSPAVVKELKKRKIMRFYSDEKKRPSPRQRKGGTSNETTPQPSTETGDPNNAVRKSACAPKWVEEVAGGNNMVRMLVKMTGISKKEFKELVSRPPTPDSDTEMDQNSPLPVRLLRKLAKNLPVSNNFNCDHTLENVGQSGIEIITNDEKMDTSQIRASYENSFVKKLIEIEKEQEQMETSGVQNGEAKSLSISGANDATQMEHSNMVNTTRRKKVSKKKLLSPLQESVTVTNDGDDVSNTILENPHSCTPRKLTSDKVGKKRKSEDAQIELLQCAENKESETDKANMIINNNNCDVNSVDPIRRSRRSSSYFVKPKRSSPSPVLQKPALVCTQLHTPDVDIVASVVEQLGTFVVEKYVTSQTTHIVSGAPKRTMKLLKGMVRGCWIVTHEWVLRSLEAGKWLDEEEFELTIFSPAVQKYRLEKLSFGGVFKPDIFSHCGPIFVSAQSAAPRGDLVELILLCGGEIVSRISKAKIAVGKNYPDVICVTALWILDSIQYYCCKPLDSYQFS